MEKKQIQLTEQDIHMIVEDAVANILKENGMNEGGLSALFGAAKNAMGKGINNMANKVANGANNMANKVANGVNNFNQGAQNLGRNMANTYQAGRTASQVNKYADQAIKALHQLILVSSKVNPKLATAANMAIGSINKTKQAAQNNLNQAAQNTFSTKAQG